MTYAMDPLVVIDETIDHLLQRPLMYAPLSVTLETLLLVTLAMRTRLLGCEELVDIPHILRNLAVERFGRSPGPLPASSLLREILGDHAFEDPRSPRHALWIGFFTDFVARVREACNAV